MTIEFMGKSCQLSPFLSMSDLEKVMKWKKDNPTSEDYRSLVAEIIAEHTDGVFSAEEISKLDDPSLQKYIKICIESDEKLQSNYFTQIEPDIYKKFIFAIAKTDEDNEVINPKAYKNISIPELPHIEVPKIEVPDFKSQLSNINYTMTPIVNVINEINNMLPSFYAEMAENLQKISDAIMHAIPDYNAVFSGLTSALNGLLKALKTPTISEEKKEQLIESYTAWGKLGWTLPPTAKFDVFYQKPENGVDAYNKLRYCTTDACMKELFQEMYGISNLKKSDLEEAIECFNGKHYKSSCLILFSMIDSKLIRAQVDEDRNRKNGRRYSGKPAAEKLFKRIEKNNDNKMFFTLLAQKNIFEALQTFFSNGNDFKAQPKILNRNFLDHGMLYRKVIRKDSVMLFLLLFNFIQLLNNTSYI